MEILRLVCEVNMNEPKPSTDTVKAWLLSPLSKEAAELVKRGKKYWAACCLMQGLTGDPQKEFDGIRVICRGPAKDGLLDARAIVFLMFTGAHAIEQATGTHPATTTFLGRRFVLSDLGPLLMSKQFNHRFAGELSGELKILSELMIKESTDVTGAVLYSLLLTIGELQIDEAEQKPYVIWQSWSEVFQAFCQQRVFSRSIAYISYLLLWSLYDSEELSTWKMWPDTAWLEQNHPLRYRGPGTGKDSATEFEERHLKSEERNQLADIQKEDFVALCEKARLIEEHLLVSSFLFIRGSDLLACSRLPMYSEVKHRLRAYDEIEGSKNLISHRWLSTSHPDPGGKQLRLLSKSIDPAQYYWIDSCCFPQKPRTPSEEKAFRDGISWLPSLFFGMNFLVLRCRDDGYLGRAWCFFELIAATVLGRSISYIVENSGDNHDDEAASRLLTATLLRGSLLPGMGVTDSVDLPAIEDGVKAITMYFKLHFIEHYMGLGQRISEQKLFFGEDPYSLLSICDISQAMAWAFQIMKQHGMRLVDLTQDYWDSNCFSKLAQKEVFRHTTNPYNFSRKIVRNDSVQGWLIMNKHNFDPATNLFYILTSMIQ